MHLRDAITYRDVFRDSWVPLVLSAVWSTLVVYLNDVRGYDGLEVPVLPVTTIGIVVSLYLGFKSGHAYERWWEARKIWGEIANDSRTWANQALNLVSYQVDDDRSVPRALVRRHLAWVHALAYQLRRGSRLKAGSRQRIFDYRLADTSDLPSASTEGYQRYLSKEELHQIRGLANPAIHIIRKQGEHAQRLMREGLIGERRLVELHQVLSRFYNAQGKCERIKNTPFPRQFTYLGRIFTWIFIILLPLSFVDEFAEEAEEHIASTLLQHEYMFMMVPFCMLVSWIFFMVEKVSESCEDPFEWGTTDVPIATLTRAIEIDLLQMIGEPDIPAPLQPRDGVLY